MGNRRAPPPARLPCRNSTQPATGRAGCAGMLPCNRERFPSRNGANTATVPTERQAPPARLGLEPCTLPVRVPGPPAEPSTVRALAGCGNNTKPPTVPGVWPAVNIRDRDAPKKIGRSVGWLVGWLVGARHGGRFFRYVPPCPVELAGGRVRRA